MNIAIDDGVRGGVAPFLLVWRADAAPVDAAGASDALRRASEAVAGEGASAAEAAIETYRAELVRLGRNPNRYRISSDALLRRLRRDGAVPSILPLVDLNNALSLRTGWPIGCYDVARIQGDVLYRLGGGDEVMSTLGKGDFDVTNLPILADAQGPFGSTISDSVRTAVQADAGACLFVLYGFGAPATAPLAELVEAVFAEAGAHLSDAPRLVV